MVSSLQVWSGHSLEDLIDLQVDETTNDTVTRMLKIGLYLLYRSYKYITTRAF